MSRHTPPDTLQYRNLRNTVRREEPLCWLCGLPWNPDARAPHPASYSLDHVLPCEHYPELRYQRDNARAAHLGCNRARANGPDALARYITRWLTASGAQPSGYTTRDW